MKNKIFKYSMLLLIGIFFFLILLSETGYYEYELSRKTKLTNESIERFEQDIKDGKKIDLNNYVITDKKDYSNPVSNLGNKVSNGIEKVISKGFKYLFKYISNQVE